MAYKKGNKSGEGRNEEKVKGTSKTEDSKSESSTTKGSRVQKTIKVNKEIELKRLTWLQHGLLIFLAVVLLTPFIQNMQFQSRVSHEIQEFKLKDRTEEVQDMNAVNDKLNEEGKFYTIDPFGGQTKYENRANMIGVLSIPKIDEELTVYDRTDNISLREGVGLLDGTNLPTGGKGNTTVLSGHNGMADATIFRNVHLLDNGDTFTFDNGVEVLTYEVYEKVVVMPDETEYIKQVPNQDTMILLTCDTPDFTKGINTHRLIVYGKRVPTETDKEDVKPVTNSNRRYIAFGATGLAVLVMVIGKSVYVKIKNK